MVSGYKSYFQEKGLLFALVLDLWKANVKIIVMTCINIMNLRIGYKATSILVDRNK